MSDQVSCIMRVSEYSVPWQGFALFFFYLKPHEHMRNFMKYFPTPEISVYKLKTKRREN